MNNPAPHPSAAVQRGCLAVLVMDPRQSTAGITVTRGTSGPSSYDTPEPLADR
ncbi:hypothetical protein AB0H00_09570 [Nocardia sp. NPDC023852]|uniref:hypothetical protein n=1 Tax=Nocardia sp. NPDC023852 TaxID=3154697 RepID=UPI0033F60F4B